ncbi:MAG: hypothetical protein H8F28_20400 [Fibrella sp.]|nr:hypothetical protein [Armatimonadota bacterium]
MSRTSYLSFTAVATIATLILTLANAHAQTVFTNEAAFDAATGTNLSFGFENIAPSESFAEDPDVSPLTFIVEGGSDPTVRVFDSVGESDRFSVNGTDSLVAGLAGGGFPATVTIAFGTGVSAFGTEISLVNSLGTTVTNNFVFVQLFQGDSPVGDSFFSNPFPTGFLGVASDDVFDRVSITTGTANGTPYQVYDNVQIQVVPEPGVATLFAIALPFLGTVISRRRKLVA